MAETAADSNRPAVEPGEVSKEVSKEVSRSPAKSEKAKGKGSKAKTPKAAAVPVAPAAQVVAAPPKPVKPAPLAAAPCCQLCVHYKPKTDHVGPEAALYSTEGNCGNVTIEPVVAAVQSCEAFRFNEALRDGLK